MGWEREDWARPRDRRPRWNDQPGTAVAWGTEQEAQQTETPLTVSTRSRDCATYLLAMDAELLSMTYDAAGYGTYEYTFENDGGTVTALLHEWSRGVPMVNARVLFDAAALVRRLVREGLNQPTRLQRKESTREQGRAS